MQLLAGSYSLIESAAPNKPGLYTIGPVKEKHTTANTVQCTAGTFEL